MSTGVHSPSLRFLRPVNDGNGRCRRETVSEKLAVVRCGKREWEEYYRRRWQYDKAVRSTHGVNCTGGCSWIVYVKDGMIVWEVQEVDYPTTGTARPAYEPRGCPRGATYSWYVYSPVRVKYPYVRGVLLEMWQEALATHPDPVSAWASIVEDPAKARRYKEARGKGGLVRVSWDDATKLIAAGLVYTIRQYGPDRVIGFTCIPAMSMVGYSSGTRFLTLLGGSILSFYDWFSDSPPASPQIWGDATDVCESADWYNSTYMIVWGTNLPQTRSPDAHFYAEARYRGTRVAAVSPDYAEYVKFADDWLPARAGTDGALAMAMTFVVLKEFYLDRQVPYFIDYAKRFTDLPFAVALRKEGENYVPECFLRASQLGQDVDNAEWKLALFDGKSSKFVVPNGSVGFRWDKSRKWNLNLQDSATGAEIDPQLTYADGNDGWVLAAFPHFDMKGSKAKLGAVPTKKVRTPDGELLVTSVFDLMIANVGLDRGHGGECTNDYTAMSPNTPAWQEAITGVPKEDAIRVAREFAHNAEATHGKSMIFLGSGLNHWYHHDITYRAIINLTTLCGCQGVNGGGWAHYTGQEAIRTHAAWTTLAFALDWQAPPRQFNGTSFFYFASSTWRYETVSPQSIISPALPEDFVPRQRRAIAGRSHLAETRLLLRGEPPDPLAAADLMAFCKLVPPEEEVAALSILCEAIRNGNERVIGRFERGFDHGTDWPFVQRAAALLEARNWAGALAATGPGSAVVKEQESRACLAQLRTACLYVLGRRGEAEDLAAHTARNYGEQHGPFDGWFLYESGITDWP